jgi:hypothetical protein
MGDLGNASKIPEDRVVRCLLDAADQFEEAIRTGSSFQAALEARKVVSVSARFYPGAVGRLLGSKKSVDVEPPADASNCPEFLRSPSRRSSPPDSAYLAIVQLAVREFKEASASGDVEKAIQSLYPTGIFSEDEDPQSEFRNLEIKLLRLSGPTRLQFLSRAAKLAFWTGNMDKAKEYATEAARLEPSDGPSNEGEGAHDGNMVLGLIALREGDTEQAKQHLLASARTNVSGAMRVTGPNLSLASELLKRNERDVVVSYLQECKRFWVVGRKGLDTWIEKLRNGESLEFDPVHLSH